MANDTHEQVLDSALTLAQFCAFGLGPEGLVLAAGVSIMQTIFKQKLSAQRRTLTTGEIVEKVLSAELEAKTIREAAATFRQTYDWYAGFYNGAWTDGDELPDDAEFDDFVLQLNEALGPNSRLLYSTQLITDKSYRKDAFLLWQLCADLHILLLKTKLLIRSTVKRVVDTQVAHDLVSVLKSAIDQIGSTALDIDAAIAARLAQVSELKHEGSTYYFEDGQPVVDKTGNAIRYEYASEPHAKVMREQVVLKLQRALDGRYYGGRPDHHDKVAAEWKKALAGLEPVTSRG